MYCLSFCHLVNKRDHYGGYVSVHLRVREVDQLVPKSLYPTSSGNTYWQVETESSLLHGQPILSPPFSSTSCCAYRAM